MADLEDRNRILAKARERFMQFGFAKVTLDEIASDLGMSKKTLYKHFESKEDLLREMVRSYTRALSGRIEGIVSSDIAFQVKLRNLLIEIGTTLASVNRQLLIDIQRYLPDLWTEVEEFRRRQLMDKMGRMVEQGIREKIFRENLNPELFLLVFISAVQGIITPSVLSNRSFSAAEAFSAILEILYAGALSDDARASMPSFDPIPSLSS